MSKDDNCFWEGVWETQSFTDMIILIYSQVLFYRTSLYRRLQLTKEHDCIACITLAIEWWLSISKSCLTEFRCTVTNQFDKARLDCTHKRASQQRILWENNRASRWCIMMSKNSSGSVDRVHEVHAYLHSMCPQVCRPARCQQGRLRQPRAAACSGTIPEKPLRILLLCMEHAACMHEGIHR